MEDLPPADGFVDPDAETPHYEEPHADRAELIGTSVDGNVFKVNGVAAATFFGGPIAGGFLLWHNYKKFHDEGMASLAVLSGFVLFIGVLSLSISFADSIPAGSGGGLLIMTAYTFWAGISQKDKIEDCKRRNQVYSDWAAAGIGIGIGIISFLVAFIVLLTMTIQSTPL